MRGLLCFLLLFALTVNMNARPQADTRITLKLDNVTLTKAMNEIKQQSRFLFINKGVDASKIVSIIVVGEKDVEANKVSLRSRAGEEGQQDIADVIARITEEIKTRA